mmetsp:Transcript_24460/g.43850  ORF Transcript_24460/g.43850 Transcript_24460/m.43850 type:complete len:202 (-) Transcript_24460:944-1549(-)
MWGHAENFLDITTHIKRLQDSITLIQNKVLNMIQLECLLPRQSQNTSRGAHHNVRTIILNHIPVGLDGNPTIEYRSLHFRQILGEPLVLVRNLEGQFTSVTENQHTDLILPRRECIGIQLVESCQHKNSRLTHTTLGLADDIHTEDSLGDAFMLDFGGVLETAIDNGAEAFRFENKVLETGGVDSYIVTPGRGVERVSKIQ